MGERLEGEGQTVGVVDSCGSLIDDGLEEEYRGGGPGTAQLPGVNIRRFPRRMSASFCIGSGGCATSQVECGGRDRLGVGGVVEVDCAEIVVRGTNAKEPKWLVWPGWANKVCFEKGGVGHARRPGECEYRPVSRFRKGIRLGDKAGSS